MSDELGTTGNGNVAQVVADDDDEIMDPDALRLRLLEEKTKRKELESHVGRQNDVHGKRIQAVRDELGTQLTALQGQFQNAQDKREAQMQATRFASMSPNQRAEAKAEAAYLETRQLRDELARRDTHIQESGNIQAVLAEATKRGLDTSQLDTSSYERALLSFQSLDYTKLQEQVEALTKERASETRQMREDVVETVTALSGRRSAQTGSPSLPAGEKLPAAIQKLVAEMEVAKRKKDRVALMDIRIRGARAGYDLG